MKTSLKTLVDLQLNGIQDTFFEPSRRGGAGPAYAKSFLIDGCCLMLPLSAHSRGYQAKPLEQGFALLKDERHIFASSLSRPKFYDLKTRDGIPYNQIALLHGKDCLASTVIQSCSRYAEENKRCRFCSLGQTLKSHATIGRKTPEQLAEVAEAAQRLDHITHITLTSGTAKNRDEGILYLGECARAIFERTGLPIQIQFEPPEDPGIFEILKTHGVANIGMHVESLDENVRANITPGKAEIPLSRYYVAFEEAIKVFGKNRVSTYVILGLGEDEELTLRETLKLISMGVYPIIVPLRDHPDAILHNSKAPSSEFVEKMYQEAGAYLRQHNMNGEKCLAGCGRCGACSLLQYTEKPELEIFIATRPEDIAACYQIRRQVFCDEQRIFAKDDKDSKDSRAIHILATCRGEPVGTVRCYERRPGIWAGGRLAVLQDHRGSLGAKLVRKAVRTMEEREDVRRFFATIQEQNLRFFTHMGWKPLGKLFSCNGRPHQIMEKILKK